MKNIKIISTPLLIFSIMMLILTACDKYLQLDPPKTQVESSVLFSDKGAIDGAINGMYFLAMTWNNGGLAGLNSCLYYVLLSDADYYYVAGTGERQLLSNGDIESSKTLTSLNSIWIGAYKSIYSANFIIENIPTATAKLTDAEKNIYLAQAYYIRAAVYFDLMQFFGDVPFITTTKGEDNNSMARTPVTEIYPKLIEDLKKASAALPATKGVVQYINSKYQVDALLARFYLQTKNYTEAEASAGSVINSGKYPLNTDLKKTFGRLFSTEIIFSAGKSSTSYYDKPFLGIITNPSSPGYSSPTPNSVVLSLYDRATDKRFAAWYRMNPSRPDVNYYKYVWGVLDAETGPAVAANPQDYVLCRSAEMYLIRAEARTLKASPDFAGAAADINVLRTRAGIPNTTATTQTALMTAIENERLMELEGEWGHRWIDLHRWGKTDAAMKASPNKKLKWQSHNVLLPIPQEQIILNANLKQNTGYAQ